MLSRHYPVAFSWRAAAVLLLSLSMAGASAPALAVPAAPADTLTSSAPPASGVNTSADQARPAAAHGRLPLSFEANEGQTDPSVDFLAHGQGYTLFFSSGGLMLSPRHATGSYTAAGLDTQGVLQVELHDADPHPQVVGQQRLPGTVNYFIGNDPRQWHAGIPIYARVRYDGVYPGVDLAYYSSSERQLEVDFVVAPGVDPDAIRLGFKGVDSLDPDATGALVVRSAGGDVRLQAPVVYQQVDEVRVQVAGAYVVKHQEVSFALGTYDASRPLVIDPVILYSTFLGGRGTDAGNSVAVDAAGNAYVTGSTASPDFPTSPDAFQRTPDGGDCGFHFSVPCPDVFVSKLNPSGTALLYSTFLGGSGADVGNSIAVDAAANAYITGFTTSPNFPTSEGAVQSTFGGIEDAFVTKLNASGTELMYSTYLGSGAGEGIAVDTAGNAYVGVLGFIKKLNSTGTALIYASPQPLGGIAYVTVARAIAVDAAGNVYVTGGVSGPAFPTTPGAFQTTMRGFGGNAFVSKLNATGTELIYSTFLGGSSIDFGTGIAVDSEGNAYITGGTLSADFPTTPGAFQTALGRPMATNAFVSKLNAAGTQLIYSTYLGGAGTDTGSSIAITSTGSAYVTGYTSSTDFPTTTGALQSTLRGNQAAFVTRLNATGTGLVFSTYLGGTLDGNGGSGVAVDAAGNGYVTGGTGSADFPTSPGAFQPTFGGGTCFSAPCLDAFVVKITLGPPACEVAALQPGPPAQLQLAVQAETGLASLVVTETTNATVAMPTVMPGTTDTLLVTATKLDQTTSSSVTLRATDQTGASTDCDPALVTIGREPGVPRTSRLHHVARGETKVTIHNGTPGLSAVQLRVNGRMYMVADFHAGERRTVDIAAAMRTGSRTTINVTAVGPRGGSAVVLVSDR
jgi:hypothetical protein